LILTRSPLLKLVSGISGPDGLVALDLQRGPYQFQIVRVVFNDEDELIRHDAPGS
jgi:hypothetical protein